jgi:L-ribulose-5-phosphate 3-epimerase
MELGTLIHHSKPDLAKEFAKLKRFGLSTCQFVSWETGRRSDGEAREILRLADGCGVRLTAFWCGWSGPQVWDFAEGPSTLGVVPAKYRAARVRELEEGSDFAKKLGVRDVVTHAGFMPENPADPEYPAIIAALRQVAEHCRENGQNFLFESGQETPTTLLRAINDIGTGNVYINLDAANLILYGKANPVDALDTIGAYVRGVHAKDGRYPTDGMHLGKEAQIGEGRVDFRALLGGLKKLGYDGAVTIEREIPDGNDTQGVGDAVIYLRNIINSL